MNERIRELEKQAYVVKEYSQYYEYISGDTQWSETVFDREKFAELIVRECAKIAEEQGSTAEHSFTATRAKWFRNGAIKSATMIKRTFGV